MECSVYFIYTDEISEEPAAGLSGKLSCNWLIMLVTMATPISSHVKDKNSIFTARDEDMFFLVKGKILVFHQYLYNKVRFQGSLLRVCLPRLLTWPKVRTHCDNGAHQVVGSTILTLIGFSSKEVTLLYPWKSINDVGIKQ